MSIDAMTSNGVILHTEALGQSGRQSVVFLHGLAGSTASWGEPFRALATDHHVLLADILGFGRSPKPALDYSLDDHLLTLHETLRQQGIKHAHFVGHSMGALLALAYAARFTQDVGKLVLLALPWYADEQDARRKIAAQSLFNRWLAIETPLAHLACTLMCQARPWLMPLMPHLLRDVPTEVAKDVLRHNWLSYSRSLTHLIIESHPAQWLAQATVPALFIQGLHDDTAPPGPVRKGIIDHPHARLETLDAGHNLIFTHAPVLAARICSYLAPTCSAEGASIS